jgi:zinc transport system substrate-binding protein
MKPQDRTRQRIPRNALATALLASLAACSGPPAGAPPPAPADAGARPSVYTTFYPTQFFASQIAQGLADVICPVPQDADPIFWQPDDSTVAAYQAADLVILNGAGFEKWAATVSLPESRTADTSAPLAGSLVHYEKAVTHSHGEAGQHSHEGLDGHTWLDPNNARAQAKVILDRLKELLPDQSSALEANFAALASGLEQLDSALREIPPGTRLLASHPAYNYLAQRYGWQIANFDFDPGEPLGDDQVEATRATLADHPTKVILWESDPLPESATRLASEFGLRSVTFSPCEQTPDDGDYLSAMQANTARLKAALE